MIQEVLFDCDGLMFETERISITMWKREAEKYGVKLPEDFFVHITGSGKGYTKQYMNSIPGVSEVQGEISKKRFNLDFWKSCAKDTLNKPGLVELFAWLNENHYRIAICSSSPKIYVETLLGTVSATLSYNAMITGDMVTRAKPDPEIFLKGAEVLGVKPEECLVLEDSKAGILAAHAAGMHSCWIKDMIEADAEMEQALEYRRNDLHEVIGLIEEINGGIHGIQ